MKNSKLNHSEVFSTVCLWKIFTKSINLPTLKNNPICPKSLVLPIEISRERNEQPRAVEQTLIESNSTVVNIFVFATKVT